MDPKSNRERFEGGILGLLLVNSDGQQNELIRLASTFYQASMPQKGDQSSLAPVVRFRGVNSQKLLHAPLSELNVRHLELLDMSKHCKLENNIHQPLSEHLDAINKLRNNRALSFAIVKEREKPILSRFVSSSQSTTGRGTSTAIQLCTWEGSKAAGDVRPPTGSLVRLDREESVDSKLSVLIGRPAWRRALCEVRMPKFGEDKVSLIELISESSAPMSSDEEISKGITPKHIVDAIAETQAFTSVRDFLKYLSYDSIDSETWDLVSKKVAELSSSEKKPPHPSVSVSVSWIPAVSSVSSGLVETLAGLSPPVGGVASKAEKNQKGGAAKGCDLDPLPQRPLKSWVQDPRPESPNESGSSFWDGAVSGTDGDVVQLGVSQGHLRLAGPVMVHSKTQSTIPIYDHIRAVEPRGVCRSSLAKSLEEASASDAEAFQKIVEEAEADVSSIAKAWNDLLAKKTERVKHAPLFATKSEFVSFDPLEYRDTDLELGIEDVFFYRKISPSKDVVDMNEGFDPDSPSHLLQEMAALLGVSPPLDIAEEREILDEMEYHLPGGEGEQSQILRKRIDDVKRRRNELMAKAGVGGKAYEAVEKRLIDRLRSDSVVKVVAEKVSYLAALLSHKAGNRIAESPSGALRACLQLPVNKKRAIAAAAVQQNKKGKVDRITLLACAGSTVIGTRCPPDAPPPREASSVEIAKNIAAIQGKFREEADTEYKTIEKAHLSNNHFRPFPEVREGRLSSLWAHVRGAQKEMMDGILINPVSSCCSYDSGSTGGVWSTIVGDLDDLGESTSNDNDSTVGIQPAHDLSVEKEKKAQPTPPEFTPISCRNPIIVTPIELSTAEPKKKVELSDSLEITRTSDPTLERELVPPSGDAVSLANETKMRIDDLLGIKDAKDATDVREVLENTGSSETSKTSETSEISSILVSFLKSELAPTLRKMSFPEITASLSADVEIAKCSAYLREPETRARLSALSDACVSYTQTSNTVFANSVTAFALWALSKAGKGLPPKSEEAAKRASEIMVKRLATKLEFGRSDRRDADTNKVKAVKEALRAANRAALDKLKDEDRELLRELKMAIRGISTESIGDDSAVVEEAVEEEARSDKETVEDARDSFF